MVPTTQVPTAPQALRRAKDASGETNRSLAEKSGVPEHTVAKIMSGATPSPTYDQVAAMAAVLDLDLNTLDYTQPQAQSADDAVIQAQLDGASQLITVYKERLEIYERGIRERNTIICALMGFLAFFATAFVIYFIMDASNPNYGFIRRDSSAPPWVYVIITIPVLAALITGHIFASRRVRANRSKK